MSIAAGTTGAGGERLTCAMGCFWGGQHIYAKYFVPGAIASKDDIRVGYAGGTTSSPSYRQVCGEGTGHAESIDVSFDPWKASYEQMVRFFFQVHDPTTPDRQGNDRGHSYRSAIFYHSEEQRRVAEKVKQEVQAKFYPSKKVVTEVVPAGTFWMAEASHQHYLEKNPSGYQCPTHYLRKWDWEK